MKNVLDATAPESGRQHGTTDDACACITPSRLNLWLRCPLAYKLKHIDGIKTPTTESQFLGQRVHAALATYYYNRMRDIHFGLRDCINSMLSGWDAAVAEQQMKFACSSQRRQLQQRAAALIQAYLMHFPDEGGEILAVQYGLESPAVDPATGEQLPLRLTGVVDLVLDSESGPVVVDFRTASRSSAALELAHEVKLSILACLVREHFGREESELQVRSLIRTKVPKIETHAFPQRRREHITRLFEILREYVESLDRGIFNYRPAWTCSMCDYAGSCCQN